MARCHSRFCCHTVSADRHKCFPSSVSSLRRQLRTLRPIYDCRQRHSRSGRHADRPVGRSRRPAAGAAQKGCERDFEPCSAASNDGCCLAVTRQSDGCALWQESRIRRDPLGVRRSGRSRAATAVGIRCSSSFCGSESVDRNPADFGRDRSRGAADCHSVYCAASDSHLVRLALAGGVRSRL